MFIIETLNFQDEKKKREGELLSEILRSWGRNPVYYYLRTKKELLTVLRKFRRSDCGYLHFSSHGNRSSLFTTLDRIPLAEYARILKPYLSNKRLFISACSSTNDKLSGRLFAGSKCVSLAGPAEDIGFPSSAMLWASFYHLAFKNENPVLKSSTIRDIFQNLSNLHRIKINYYEKSRETPEGYRRFRIVPGESHPEINYAKS